MGRLRVDPVDKIQLQNSVEVLKRRVTRRHDPCVRKRLVVSANFHKLFFTEEPQVAHNIKGRRLVLAHKNPNVYFCDEFLTEAENQFISRYVETISFEHSYMEDEESRMQFSSYRTSTFAYLQKYQNSLVTRIESRAAEIVGCHPHTVEPLQIVSYTENQHFDIHHDSGTVKQGDDDDLFTVELCNDASGGIRIITIFVYLNSLPADANGQSTVGGETEFPRLSPSGEGSVSCSLEDASKNTGRRFTPKRNRAVIWANVLPCGTPDINVLHMARAVSGSYRKFGMNIWITDKEQFSHILASANLSARNGFHLKANPLRGMMLPMSHCPTEEKDALCGLCGSRSAPTMTVVLCVKNRCFNGVHRRCCTAAELLSIDAGTWTCWVCRLKPIKKLSAEKNLSQNKGHVKLVKSKVSALSHVSNVQPVKTQKKNGNKTHL